METNTLHRPLPIRHKNEPCCDPVKEPALGQAETAALAGRLKAVADPTRLRMLDLLARQDAPLCVCDLTDRFAQNQPTISHHLKLLRDAFRVLKPGGRFAIADVVATRPVPTALRHDMEAWAGCLAGALEIGTYSALLAQAGFEQVSIDVTRRYSAAAAGLDSATLPDEWQDAGKALASAFVRATKPLSAAPTRQESGTGQARPVAATSAGCCGG